MLVLEKPTKRREVLHISTCRHSRVRHASFHFFSSWASYGRTKEARGERKEQFSRKKRNVNDCSVQSGEEGWAMTNERFAR